MDRLNTTENHVAGVVSSAYVPPFQLTEGQPPPIAANGGLSYMSFDRDGMRELLQRRRRRSNRLPSGKGRRLST